ncbi:MAG: type II toxin-antitoxin system HicA family toxin [Lachnospiraceae bacterium]|nr:type II toxin-antitoxin system HicA family toxin [Lachnospiraceae bacterium]
MKYGWYEVDKEGSHMQLKHPTKPRKVTVAVHGKKDIPPGTLNKIRKQAGLK